VQRKQVDQPETARHSEILGRQVFSFTLGKLCCIHSFFDPKLPFWAFTARFLQFLHSLSGHLNLQRFRFPHTFFSPSLFFFKFGISYCLKQRFLLGFTLFPPSYDRSFLRPSIGFMVAPPSSAFPLFRARRVISPAVFFLLMWQVTSCPGQELSVLRTFLPQPYFFLFFRTGQELTTRSLAWTYRTPFSVLTVCPHSAAPSPSFFEETLR